jgi:hypothetical protein
MIGVMGGTVVLRGECNMAQSQELKEQRKHDRFTPKEWVSAHCQAPFVGIGTLVDISMGGAAFQYVQRIGFDLAVLKTPLKLDLFETVTSRGVKEIECKVVYDTEVPKWDNSSGAYRLRRCAVEFGEHSWYQSFLLDQFIKHFTVVER